MWINPSTNPAGRLLFVALLAALGGCAETDSTASGPNFDVCTPGTSGGEEPPCEDDGPSYRPGLFFAPFIFQDIDGLYQDNLTNFTYDDDWAGGNNWDNIYSYPLRSFVYASITRTSEFDFVYYSLFHPRDWTDSPQGGIDTHENDLESVLVVVDRRYTSTTWPFGTPVIVETRDHALLEGPKFRSYVNCSFTGYAISNDEESSEGCV